MLARLRDPRQATRSGDLLGLPVSPVTTDHYPVGVPVSRKYVEM
jgi:hypothetical protein